MAVFAGMVTGMDRNIGRLVADLRAHGELERTLIFFLSDNGACAEWEPFGFDLSITNAPVRGSGINLGTQAAPNLLRRGAELQSLGGPGTGISYGSGWANAGNTPWRLYKHYGHEGGIGTPMIAHWPEGIGTERRGDGGTERQREGEKERRGERAGGRFSSEPSHLIDLMATCVDLGGAKYPGEIGGHKILPMEGVSLRSQFSLSRRLPVPPSPRLLAWEHEGNRALREGNWKLVALAGQPWELYDLSNDRVEMNDLASSEPVRVARMAAQWDAWAARTHVLPRPGAGAKKN
jgi:arylsulfatase